MTDHSPPGAWDKCKADESSYACVDLLAFVEGSSYDCTCEVCRRSGDLLLWFLQTIPFLVATGLCPAPLKPVPWPPAKALWMLFQEETG